MVTAKSSEGVQDIKDILSRDKEHRMSFLIRDHYKEWAENSILVFCDNSKGNKPAKLGRQNE